MSYSYQKAYIHLFNRMSEIIELVENPSGYEEINISLLLKQIQNEGEEIVISN